MLHEYNQFFHQILKTMKNFKTSLLAIALIAGIGSAFAAKIAQTPKSNETTYDWTRTSGSPIPGEVSPFNGKTMEEAELNYGCDGDGLQCARGVNPENPADIVVIKFD